MVECRFRHGVFDYWSREQVRAMLAAIKKCCADA